MGSLSLCVLCAAPAFAPATAVAATTRLSLPPIAISPNLSVELPPVKVELPPVKVELPLLPKVEVSLPTVEASLPKVEVATSPPPETTSTPTSSTPAPAPPPPSSPSSPGGETQGTGGGATKSSGTGDAATATIASVSSPSSQAPATRARAVTAAEPTSRKQAARRSRKPSPLKTAARGGPARLLAASHPTAHTPASSGSSPARRAHAAEGANPLDALGRRLPIPLPVPDWSKPIILLLALAALWFGARSRLAVRRAHRLEGQRDLLLQDLGVMQTTLVPVIPRRVGELAVSVAYRPADGPAAGGDFYDVFELEGGRVAVLLGDVAGHGHEALTQAALTRYTLRAYLQASLKPRAALALAGSVLADAAAAHFATVAVGVYDGSRGTFSYASAGHPPPILAGFDAPEPLTVCCSPPVGWDVPTGRRQTTLSLPSGAIVCFFSDGLIEARTDEGLLGRQRVAAILAQLGPRPSSSDLLARVQASAEATPDDMVACILVPQVGVSSVSCHVEELEVDAEDLGGDGVQRFLEACEVAASEVPMALARVREILATGETALLHVECASGARPAAVAVLPGLETPVETAAVGGSSAALAADVADAGAGRPGHASGAIA